MTTPRRRLQLISADNNKKARMRGVPGVITAEMLAMTGNQCAYCGVTLSIMQGTWDHAVPFSRGGTNEISNIRRCCATCNREKGSKTPEEYQQWRELRVTCPICGKVFQPRWGEWVRGKARYCSHSCAVLSRWTPAAGA